MVDYKVVMIVIVSYLQNKFYKVHITSKVLRIKKNDYAKVEAIC